MVAFPSKTFVSIAGGTPGTSRGEEPSIYDTWLSGVEQRLQAEPDCEVHVRPTELALARKAVRAGIVSWKVEPGRDRKGVVVAPAGRSRACQQSTSIDRKSALVVIEGRRPTVNVLARIRDFSHLSSMFAHALGYPPLVR